MQQVFALWEPAPRRHHDPLGLALTGLSQVYQQQHRDREAEAILLPLLQIGQLALGEGHPLHTYPMMVLAEVYQTQGRLAEAEECYQWCLVIREEAWGPHHFRTKEVRAAYAALLRAMGRGDEAASLEAAQPVVSPPPAFVARL